MMAFFNINQAPHITDPEKLTRFFEKSIQKSHPVQKGGGFISNNNDVQAVGSNKQDRQDRTSINNATIRLVTPVEAQTARAREAIKEVTTTYNTKPKKRTKANTSHSSPTKRRKI